MPSNSDNSNPANIDNSKMKGKGGVNIKETESGIEITVGDIDVKKIRDQKQQMIEAIGCYNNPGGPTC